MPQSRRQFVQASALAPLALTLRPASLLAQEQDGLPEDVTPANVFFSPCGRPYRAKPGAPYPVGEWFKQADANADGKIDHPEFMADTLAFFKILDRNGDGVISPQELAFYEQRLAPEVLGMRVVGTSNGLMMAKPLLWRTQMGGMGGMGGPGGGIDTNIDPGGGEAPPDESQKSRPYDASGKGAAPYSFFDEPEPVAAADFHFRGLISKADFLKLAEAHFTSLDADGRGFLTLDRLPKTPVQRRLERARRHR